MTPEQKFRELLAHAWTHSPLYRRLYTQHGIREQDLSHVALQDLPVVSKADVMVHFDEAVTDTRLRLGPLNTWLKQDSNPLSLYLDEYVVIHSSGGSSIQSVVPYTPRTWQFMATTAAPDILPVSPDTRAPMRSAFYFKEPGHLASSTNASLASRSAHQVLWLSLDDPSEEVCAKLNTFKPEQLTSFASTMAWLAEWTIAGKLRIRPRVVVVSGDRLSPYIRSRIREAWDADIYDLYAAVESHYMAVQKPRRSDYQVFTDLNILEVVDASHRMVQPGQRGRIVLTHLINRTLPLIRFDLNDNAILGAVGFGAETLERIDGKANIELRVRLANGEVASLPIQDLHSLQVPGCGKVQFISYSPDEVEVHYEASQDLDAEVEAAFRALLAAASAVPRRIRIRRMPRIQNDTVTAKYLDIVTPDRTGFSPARLSDTVGTCREPQSTATLTLPTPAPPSAMPPSVFGRFQEIANHYPVRVAVTDGEHHLTYEACNRAALRIARALLQRGFDPRRPLAILSSHQSGMIPPILGILGAGGYYLALDPNVPPQRTRMILTEMQPEYILAVAGQEEAARTLAEPHMTVLKVDDLLAAESTVVRLPNLSEQTPACVLYTSGSAGTPKGVVFSHETVLHRVLRYTEDFKLCADDRLSLLQSYSVSAGVRDIFGALLNGATLAVYDIRSRGMQALPGWLNRNGVSVFYAVPTIWRMFLEMLSDETFPSIRVVRLGGEAVQPRDLDGFKSRFRRGCLLVNGYAATESDTICQYVMDHDTTFVANRVPVGIPVQGMTVTLLDDSGHDVVDAIGEIAVEGKTLAVGYWDANKRRIVPLRKGAFPIGDLGYQLADGRIFLTGRRDFIVNVHGYRIDLTGIEKALSTVEGISECAAISCTTAHNDVTLAIYYVSIGGVALPLEKVRQAASSALPGPTLPISFIHLPALPRLPGGKVNRSILQHHLPSQGQAAGAAAIYRSQTEKSLARIWQSVLDLQGVPEDADFFALGGDSIQVFRVLSQVRDAFKVEVPIRDFFNHSTIPQLAAIIDKLLAHSF